MERDATEIPGRFPGDRPVRVPSRPLSPLLVGAAYRRGPRAIRAHCEPGEAAEFKATLECPSGPVPRLLQVYSMLASATPYSVTPDACAAAVVQTIAQATPIRLLFMSFSSIGIFLYWICSESLPA
ncbi:protein of unknown function [Cupriavidus neocaledonicus]|uniref:Uncharacterized protein n=1 Tax=Cupriavidus neocaledonicus TaxID=1040979 RepID=A0A375H639_9BURK|nr:protein of unknown function [Cupriavidus neocaledonicus]